MVTLALPKYKNHIRTYKLTSLFHSTGHIVVSPSKSASSQHVSTTPTSASVSGKHFNGWNIVEGHYRSNIYPVSAGDSTSPKAEDRHSLQVRYIPPHPSKSRTASLQSAMSACHCEIEHHELSNSILPFDSSIFLPANHGCDIYTVRLNEIHHVRRG